MIQSELQELAQIKAEIRRHREKIREHEQQVVKLLKEEKLLMESTQWWRDYNKKVKMEVKNALADMEKE
ncbi:hypothetical protein SBOR_2581 [Sclerotinia borealis F-4128]|uniref:Uncharacterized protein n=1 Tax=Sclerotinia borealis (strain F-4128) TaxID=1432307 RepID=W9CMG8_SCLBF|nr:hypothetical protein SBOR_2581 [Sclerotinia borealis F-4128]